MKSSMLSGTGQLCRRLAADVAGLGLPASRPAPPVTVADASGPENDASELVTYLNDAVFFAPSMLLALPVSWAPAGDASFDVTLEDCGHRVTARVFTDERGAPVDFSTDDRWCDLPGGAGSFRGAARRFRGVQLGWPPRPWNR